MVSEITKRRKEGNLNQAYSLAAAKLEKDPLNPWSQRDMGWVLYEMLKKHNQTGLEGKFLRILEKIKQTVTISEPLLQEKVLKQVNWRLYQALTDNKPKIEEVEKLLSVIIQMAWVKPGPDYSRLLQNALKMKGWDLLKDFIDWWDLSNLTPEDYQPFKLANEKKIISLAERACIALGNALLTQPDVKTGELLSLIDKLEKIEKSYPNFQYIPLALGKLLLAVGDKEAARKKFISMILKDRKKFWLWELLSSTFGEDSENELMCLANATLCKTRQEYLVKCRQKLAEKMIARKLYAEASEQINKLVGARREKGWKIPEIVEDWRNSEWYMPGAKGGASQFYNDASTIAENILYQDHPIEIAVVSWVNVESKTAGFVISKEKHGLFPYWKYFKQLSVGDAVRIRIRLEKHKNVVIWASPADGLDQCKARREFQGALTIKRGFGIVGQTFIPPHLLEGLKEGRETKGIAVMSYDKKRDRWGWAAVRIIH